MARIKKNDKVVVISGKDKGKKSEVIAILPKKDKIKIKGVAITTRHLKPRKQGDVGGIKKSESYISLSKVMPFCSSCDKAVRVGAQILENGKKARICVGCKKVI